MTTIKKFNAYFRGSQFTPEQILKAADARVKPMVFNAIIKPDVFCEHRLRLGEPLSDRPIQGDDLVEIP